MNYKKIFVQLSNLTLVLLLLVSCSDAQPTSLPIPPTEIIPPAPSVPTPDEAAIEQIVIEAGKVETKEEKDEVETKEVDEVHSIVKNINRITYLGDNDEIIWPGSLVRGDSINDIDFVPIIAERAPITLSISLEQSQISGSRITQRIADPKLSTVRQGISDLLKEAIQPGTTVPARVEFSYQSIYSESQMNLALETYVKYGAGKLNAKFDWESNTKNNKIIAKYRQIYYSIDVDPSMSPADLFAPSMTTTKLAAAMPAGSKPLYVADVSYGMMALMFIETNETEENIKAALNAAYNSIVVSGSVNLETSTIDILKNSSMDIFVRGGSTKGLDNLSGYEGFMEVIKASTDFGPDTPGVALDYKFKHLADNTPAYTSLSSQFAIPIQKMCGPFGGKGGAKKDIVYFQNTPFAIRLSYGNFIDRIEIIYPNGDRKEFGGGGGGNPEVINFSPGEYIQAISIRSGSYIDQITIKTNFRSYGSYGGAGGAEHECGGPGWQVTGLEVHYGSFVDQLGWYLKKVPVTPTPVP